MADEEKKPGQTLFQHGEWIVKGQEGEGMVPPGATSQAKGHAANFPGTVTAWEWSEPAEWPDYVLHLAGLAFRRRLFDLAVGEAGIACLRMLSGRLLGTLIGPENLTEAIADCAREFEIDPNRVTYWLLAIGLLLLGRESVDPAEIKRVTVVTEEMLQALLRSKAGD